MIQLKNRVCRSIISLHSVLDSLNFVLLAMLSWGFVLKNYELNGYRWEEKLPSTYPQ